MLYHRAVVVLALLAVSLVTGFLAYGPSASAQSVSGLGPQLFVESIELSPDKPSVGQVVDVDVEVTNGGGTAAATFYVDFYQDLAGPPALLAVGDVSCNIEVLAPISSTTCSGQVVYDAPGSYDAWAQVDTDDDVFEEQENDNVFGPMKVDVNTGADLTITDVELDPAKPIEGEEVDVSITVRNIGPTTSGVYYVDFYRDLPSPPLVDELGDMFCDMPELPANTSDKCSGTIIYPSAGSFDSWVQVDTLDEVGETNEFNNIEALVVDVNAGLDLVIKDIDLDPAKPLVGETVDVDVEVSNTGSEAVPVSFFVDFYQDRAGPPLLFEFGDFACEILALGAGASTVCSGTVTYDAPGSYDIWAQADTDDDLFEGDELNNIFGPEKVDVNAPAAPTSTPTPTAVPATSTPTATPVPEKPVGDVNDDGSVNAIDAALVLQYGAGLLPSLPNAESGDANEDGFLNALDAALILQHAAGLLPVLPP